MPTKFQIKRTSVSGRTPNTTNAANSSYIAAGELALNLTDKKMYSSNGTNYFEIGSFKVEQTNSTSNVSTFTEISTLQFDEDSGFAVTSPSTGVAKIAINSTFKFWQVDGVQKLTAAGLDTVNFIGGNNIIITANGANTPQSIAFSTSLTPTFTSATFGNSTVNTTVNSSSIAVTKIIANGATGSAGKVLSANSTGGIYWETSAGGTGTLTITSDTFNGNNSNTIFTLSVSSTTDRSFVYLNGVQQAPTTDYAISGTTLTFVAAPATNNVIEVRSFDIPSIADITITSDTFTANGTQTNFTLSTPDSSVTNSLVFLNGVTQVPTTDYTLSSTTLTFLSAPVNGTAVQAISFTSAGVKSAAFTGNGSNTQFTLPVTSTTSKTIVAINGVTQTPVTDYSVSGTTLIFAAAPANNDNILVRVLPSKVDSAGSNTQIQYNKSGSLGGSAGFTFNETTNNVTIANTLTVPNFILNASNPPANSTSTGTTGTFAWDSSFFYVATGTNTWKKVPISANGVVGSAVTAGSNTEIQFNDSGSLGASLGLVFNKDSNTLTVSNTFSTVKILANDSIGTSGQVLTSNGTGIYWGTGGGGGGSGLVRDTFTANSTVNNNFTLSKQPANEAQTLVFVDRVLQRDADYSLSGTTLLFVVNLDNGAELDVYISDPATTEAAGSNTHILFNDSNFANGSAAFRFNKASNTLTLSNTISIGSNTISIGNSTVNTTVNSTAVVAANLSGNGASVTSVNAITLQGNSVNDILTAANTAANTTANTLANNYAATAYNNAVAYAASNTYVNNTFLPLAGGTLTGALTVNATANVVSNLSANNVTFRGNVQIDGNLTVAGDSVIVSAVDLKITDNMILLNEPEVKTITGASSNGTHFIYVTNQGYTAGMTVRVTGVDPVGYNVTDATITSANSTTFAVANAGSPGTYVSGGTVEGRSATQPDLGVAGEYDDGSVKHAGIFRDATDGVWKVFDSLVPEPNGAFVDTANNTFRIADFQANAITMASGSLTGTLTVKAISSNGSIGTAGQLLASNGTSTYWINPPASTNVDAQYAWTNTHTFSNTITFGNTTVNTVVNSTSVTIGSNNATVGTAVYVVANGNVGINTATPSAKLDVSGTAKFTTVNSTRIDPRVSSTTSTSSITPDVSAFDQYCVTAQAATLTFNAPTGTPLDGNRLLFRILDNGTPQTITWNATYTAMGAVLPTLTTANKMIYVGCIYNAANTRWDVIAVTQQA